MTHNADNRSDVYCWVTGDNGFSVKYDALRTEKLFYKKEKKGFLKNWIF